jgi:AraC-like DNA-binding protein
MLEVLPVLSTFLTAVLAALMIVVLLTIKENRATRLLLVILIAMGALYQIIVFMRVTGRISEQSLWYESQYPFHLGAISLVYLYVCSLTERDFNFSDISPWHILAFLAGWIWCLPEHFWGLNPTSAGYLLVKFARPCFSIGIALPYLWAAQRQVSTLKHNAKESNGNLLCLRLPWLRFLLTLWHISVLVAVLDVATGLRIPCWFFASLTFTLEFVGLAFFGLRGSQLFRLEFRPASTATLTVEDLEHRTTELVRFLQREEFYLRPQIRLSDLAAALGVKNYLLSEVINRGLGTNFYDLINGLRIERAKQMLQEPAFAHLNLLGIATDCGFNSKSSFNECFRRFAGMTPSKYRNLHSQKLDLLPRSGSSGESEPYSIKIPKTT